MSNGNNPISFRFPLQLNENGEPDIQAQIRYLTSSSVDLNQAIVAMKEKFDTLHSTVTTLSSSTSSGSTPTPPAPFPFAGLGAVNDQTGVTAYTILNSDNGILLILNDASPVAVTLDSSMITPYFLFVINFGEGQATLTPTTGTVNGSASLELLQNHFQMIVFDGTNWRASSPIPKEVAFGTATLNGDLNWWWGTPDIKPIIVNVKDSGAALYGPSGLNAEITWTPTVDATGTGSGLPVGGYLEVNLDSQPGTNTYNAASAFIAKNLSNTIAADTVIGVYGLAENAGNAAVTHLFGQQSHAVQSGGGSVTNDLIAHLATAVQSGGSTFTMYGFYADSPAISAGTVGTCHGLFVAGPVVTGGGAITTYYGVKLDVPASPSGVTTAWAIYSGNTAQSYFAGPVAVPYLKAQVVYSAAGTAIPSAATAGIGARAFVSDATVATFGSAYVSGGTNKVPVYSNGANWFIG